MEEIQDLDQVALETGIAIKGSRRSWGPTLAMIAAAGFWGSATVMSKASLSHFHPTNLLAIQLGASICFLWLLAVFKCDRSQFSWALLQRGAIGLFEPGLAYLFVLWGLKSTTASTATLIATTEPLFVLGLSPLLIGKRSSPWLFLFAGVALFGVYLTLAPDQAKNPFTGNFGSFYILVGTLFAALYVVLSRASLGLGDPLIIAAAQQSYGLAFILLFLLVAPGQDYSVDVDHGISQISMAALTGIVQYGLAFWFYLIAIQRMDVRCAALLLNLIPVFGIISSYLFLQERFELVQWIGATLILGIAWVTTCFHDRDHNALREDAMVLQPAH